MARLQPKYRCAALSVVKHAYVPRGMAAHPRYELVVVADDAQQPAWAHERNERFAAEYRVPYVRDVERALREFEVDVAIVSSQVDRHVDLSVRAALAGKHVVQDKPLTTSRAEADRLVAAMDQADVRFMMWNRNGLPSVVHAKERLAAGAVGQPYAMHVDFYFAKDAGPPKGSRSDSSAPLEWLTHQIAAHRDNSDGGLSSSPMGELMIEGIYPLAYVRHLLGRDVRRVFATTDSVFHQLNVDNGVEDLAAVSLELDGGLIATLAIGRIGAASHPSGGEIKIHVLGDGGALVVRESLPEVGVFYREQPAGERRMRRVADENDFLLADNFARAIELGCETMLDARPCRAIFRTVEAALESARRGQAVVVEPLNG